MQKKNDRFLDKIVKKDYNNELERVLEKKYFNENAKSILLSILYKIEISYKDYKHIKQNVETKEEIIEEIIKDIQDNCNEIKLVKPNSEEAKLLNGKTFLIEKKNKIIFCHPIERKLLYAISKISRNNKIIKDKYFLINETLSDLINIGYCINRVEPLRDFNGYSWTSISKEIESVEHNLIYQNLILLLGNEFIDKWVKNKEVMLDYMEKFTVKLEENYDKKLAKELIEKLKDISILLEMKYDKDKKIKIQEIKLKVDEKLDEIKDNKTFVEKLTKEKRNLAKEIKSIDETINDKNKLQDEYDKRNRKLPLEEKIFSIRILSKMMKEDREKKIKKLEMLNRLLNPQRFVKYKKELEAKQNILNIIETEDVQEEIDKIKLDIQKIFLKCLKTKIEKIRNKQEMVKLIYEFRYYEMLFFDYERKIKRVKELHKEIVKIEKLLINKAHNMKIIERFSKQEDIDYELLKCIFSTRSANLEDIYVKLKKEDNAYFIYVYDENICEEKIQLQNTEAINKKDLYIRFNKKVRAFC